MTKIKIGDKVEIIANNPLNGKTGTIKISNVV